ncbi:MAG: sodium:solute symporter family protein [Thermoprotei archaeon]|nr:MAG: sodium:solute symporter family protein [Thermoprotei archaeon]
MIPEWQIALGILLAYFAFCLGKGFFCYFRYRPVTLDEYFLAGRGLSWLFLVLTYVATLQSAFAFLGATGMYYTHGIGFMVLPLSQAWCALMTLFLGYRLWLLSRKYRYLTPGDFFDHRYRSRVLRLIVALTLFIFNMFYFAVQFVGISWAFVGVTGGHITYQQALLLTVLITGIYTIIGGMRAVVLTDVFQALVLLTTLPGAVIYAVSALGGIPHIFKLAAEKAPALLCRPGPKGAYTDVGWIYMWLVLPFGIWCTPALWVRFYTAKDKRGIAACAIGMPLSQIIIFCTSALFAGIAAAVLYPGLKRPDYALMQLLTATMPLWLIAVIMSGCLAAGMSTIDSMLLVSSQMVVKDIVIEGLRTRISEKAAVRLSMLISAALIAMAYLIALSPPKLIVEVVIKLTFVGTAQVAPALILGLYWRRVTKWGAITGLLTGLIVLVSFRIMKVAPLGIPDFIWAFALNWLVTILVSYATKVTNENVEEVVEYLRRATDA